MNEDWISALNSVAEDVLSGAGINEPPVDAFLLADRLQIAVAVDDSQPMRGRLKTLNGSPAAFLRPDDRPERLQWALAHEIGESQAWRVAEQIDDVETVSPGLREEIANRLASRLLLPAAWFFADADASRSDLNALKQRYVTASYALIAMRLLDHTLQPAIVTIVDQGRISCRKSNVTAKPPGLFSCERDALGEAHLTGEPANRQDADFDVNAWPVHEPSWKREIGVTALADNLVGEMSLEIHAADF